MKEIKQYDVQFTYKITGVITLQTSIFTKETVRNIAEAQLSSGLPVGPNVIVVETESSVDSIEEAE